MRQTGCNMTNTESYVRFFIASVIIIVAFIFDIWYLLLLSLIIYYTAFTKYCLMLGILGINKKLSVENYFHALLPKYSPYASCIFNEVGDLIFINQAAKDAFNKIKNANFFGIIYPRGYIDCDAISNMLFEHQGQTYQLHIQGVSKEKILLLHINNITEVLNLEYINSHLKSEVAHVLTDNELKNHLLVQQNKLATTGELIENIIHQWKQPLSTLNGLVQNIQMHLSLGTLDSFDLEKDMLQAQKLIIIMSATLDDFKNFFKADKKPSIFSINACIDDVMLILGASLAKENIEVSNRIDQSIKVQGYKNEFTQVLLNIVNNAKDAFAEVNPEVRHILIETSTDADKVMICITDTAGGIPKKYLEKIFDSRFTTKEEREGTGIGLHMSKIIIENDMKGKVTADNYENGARFRIELPRIKDPSH